MSAIDYDCEFLEAGHNHPIRLISIGLVADNGDELYRVMGDSLTMQLAVKHPWLVEHVLPMLPIQLDPTSAMGFRWDTGHHDFQHIRARKDFADEVLDFIRAHCGDDPELWAWYGAYDHVALCQLFGTMADLPTGIPMYTHDLKQEADRLGNPKLPALPGARTHRAIDDALECQYRRRWLADRLPGTRR